MCVCECGCVGGMGGVRARAYLISPDLYFVHVGSHACTYTKPLIVPKCRELFKSLFLSFI